ncbi:hypothetical protein [Ferruginibacter sp.]
MKKMFFGIAALMLAAGFAAFTTAPKVTTLQYTYKYTGSAVTGENLAANYIAASSTNDCNDDAPEMVCFIETSFAPDVNNHPQFPGGTLNVRSSSQVIIDHWKVEP